MTEELDNSKKKPYIVMIPKVYIDILEMMCQNVTPIIKLQVVNLERLSNKKTG